ncbi:hypothetical protein SDC9_207719 [bioreactor metagenome]|uniref:Uncharacterized protein n=1 Tax=bioreactor metagenome TaxID=1076179 RepID=A0A645J992_9ZZZZ
MTLLTITKHMEANIRHQPVKISDVLRLPPTPKANGAQMVSIPRITYRSAISNNSPKTLNITMISTIMISSHAAPIPLKALSFIKVICTASGICRILMMFWVILRPILQICGLAISKKENAKVRVKSSFGSSPSNPSPETMLLRA